MIVMITEQRNCNIMTNDILMHNILFITLRLHLSFVIGIIRMIRLANEHPL